MKKVKIQSFILFLVGLGLLSLGVVLVVKSNLGISVATSVPYVFSLQFTKLSFGQWNYIIHGSTILLLVLIVKKLTVKYLMSFIVAFLFGVTIDFFTILLTSYIANTILERIVLFMIASIIISIGIASLIKSNYPILPFDTFIKEITESKKIQYKKFKTGFDLVCFTISVISCIIFFGRLQGLHVGTLVSAIILGSMIGTCLDFMNKYVIRTSILPDEKIKVIIDFDFIEFSKSKITS